MPNNREQVNYSAAYPHTVLKIFQFVIIYNFKMLICKSVGV